MNQYYYKYSTILLYLYWLTLISGGSLSVLLWYFSCSQKYFISGTARTSHACYGFHKNENKLRFDVPRSLSRMKPSDKKVCSALCDVPEKAVFLNKEIEKGNSLQAQICVLTMTPLFSSSGPDLAILAVSRATDPIAAWTVALGSHASVVYRHSRRFSPIPSTARNVATMRNSKAITSTNVPQPVHRERWEISCYTTSWICVLTAQANSAHIHRWCYLVNIISPLTHTLTID